MPFTALTSTSTVHETETVTDQATESDASKVESPTPTVTTTSWALSSTSATNPTRTTSSSAATQAAPSIPSTSETKRAVDNVTTTTTAAPPSWYNQGEGVQVQAAILIAWQSTVKLTSMTQSQKMKLKTMMRTIVVVTSPLVDDDVVDVLLREKEKEVGGSITFINRRDVVYYPITAQAVLRASISISKASSAAQDVSNSIANGQVGLVDITNDTAMPISAKIKLSIPTNDETTVWADIKTTMPRTTKIPTNEPTATNAPATNQTRQFIFVDQELNTTQEDGSIINFEDSEKASKKSNRLVGAGIAIGVALGIMIGAGFAVMYLKKGAALIVHTYTDEAVDLLDPQFSDEVGLNQRFKGYEKNKRVVREGSRFLIKSNVDGSAKRKVSGILVV
jgi:hypothetical protein